MLLDPRSLILIVSLLATICFVILFALRRSFPSSIGGLATWAWSGLAILFSAVLFGLRGRIPDLVSVILGNGLLLGGMMAMGDGLRRFGGMPLPAWGPRAVLLAAMLAPVGWLSLVQPNYTAGTVIVTFYYAVLLVHLTMLTLRAGGRGFATRLTAVAFALSAVASAVRCLSVVLGLDRPQGIFDATAYQLAYLAAFNLTLLLSTIGFILMANERLRETLERLAAYDELSGVLNRRAFLEQAEAELARAARSGQPLSLLMLDLDHFKAINDRHGHLVGDRVIADFARRVRAQLRRPDIVGRYGGEEFVVLLPEIRLDETRMVAERILQSLGGCDDLPRYTVSIGAAMAYAGMPLIALLRTADQALYRAKENGRNRVETADDAMPEGSASAAH